jgi:purine-binding chemotaxis protein CheW
MTQANTASARPASTGGRPVSSAEQGQQYPCIVIMEITTAGERQDVGIVVDSVDAVLDIPSSNIEPPPAFGARISTDFIHGTGKVNGRFVILLDGNSVLAPEEAELLHTTAPHGV